MNERVESRQATGVDSIAPDFLRKEVQIGFTMNDEFVLVIHLPAGSIAQLVLRLEHCSQELSLEGNQTLAQPMRLRSVEPFVLRDGRKGLYLGLGGLMVPLVLSAEQIAELRNKLELLPYLETDSGHRLS